MTLVLGVSHFWVSLSQPMVADVSTTNTFYFLCSVTIHTLVKMFFPYFSDIPQLIESHLYVNFLISINQ
jgi:hypothetical protein